MTPLNPGDILNIAYYHIPIRFPSIITTFTQRLHGSSVISFEIFCLTLGRHCTNVIQMYYYTGRSSHDGLLVGECRRR